MRWLVAILPLLAAVQDSTLRDTTEWLNAEQQVAVHQQVQRLDSVDYEIGKASDKLDSLIILMNKLKKKD